MADKTRGAKLLIGVTIARVHAQCINQIILVGTDGTKYFVDAEPEGPLGVPVITVTKEPDHG